MSISQPIRTNKHVGLSELGRNGSRCTRAHPPPNLLVPHHQDIVLSSYKTGAGEIMVLALLVAVVVIGKI
jgi:hypothetical protein